GFYRGPAEIARVKPFPDLRQRIKDYRVFPLCLMMALLWGWACPAATQQAPAAPAVDPATGVVHSQRLASGVPLGGLGTGTFQIMTDGAVSHATFNNN